jgi:o-succinylbenzoate synthase
MRVDVFDYSVALTKPLVLNVGGAPSTLQNRDGLLLRFEFNGQKIITECAPLPGFSVETLAQCCEFLGDKENINRLFECLDAAKPLPISTPTSLVYAFEAAWFLKNDPFKNSPLNSQLNTDDQWHAFSKNSVCQLYQTAHTATAKRLKLKVGRSCLKDDIQSINHLSSELSEHQKVRLDANQSWSLLELDRLLRSIELEKIDYLEEPLAPEQRHEYVQISDKYEVKFALDESLRQLSPQECLAISVKSSVSTWVIKPMLTGFNKTCELIDIAQKNNIEVVLSASFESNISLEFYAQMARFFNLNSAQGLDTLSYLSTDLLHHSGLRSSAVKVNYVKNG